MAETTTTTTLAPVTGRQERTGESPNDASKNQTAAPPGISNIFKNTFNPTPIELSFPADTSSKQEVASNTGFLPFVWYNTYQISYTDISYFQLSTDGLMPVVKIIFNDSANLMKDKGMPLDDSKIKIFINPRNKNLKPILLEFKITVFKVNGGTYTLAGILDVNKLYVKEFKSFKSTTSYQALQSIFREMGLGFNTNIDDTNDSMTWINTGERVYNFINSILETSYKSDESFLLGYIDYYYHFNYVDIEKELNRNLKEELGISSFGLEEAAQIKDKEKLASLFLTNDRTRENSNTYISNYRIINNSTNISILEGYLTKVKYYDDINKDLLVFDVDSITSQGDKIILKGAPQNEDFFRNNINLKYVGKLDIDNTHRNYNYSYIQNIRNITDLQKISLAIELSTPNFNLYRFQKVQVMITNTPTPSQKGVNNRLSGEWFIVDIKFEMSRGRFYQKIQLVKRDLELSPEELASESNSGTNQSQTPSAAKANNSLENTTNPTDLKNTDVASTVSTPTDALVTTTTTISAFTNQTEVTGTASINTTTTTTTVEPGPNYTFSVTLVNGNYLAKVYNNGRLINQQNYSSVTYTEESINKELKYKAQNFGFFDSVNGTGPNPPQPNLV
jgi:hypothetical protein